MKRLLMAAAALAIGVTAVSAQSDPVAERKAIMKKNGDEAKIGAAMAKGEAPFDLAAAKTIFATYASAPAKVKPLFPETAKTGKDSTAAPKIWEAKADFEARLDKLGTDSKAAEASVKDLDSFKTAFAAIGKDCGGCHETYRIKKN
jgi:cytochrome c556